MHRALWLLTWLRFVGWIRRVGRLLSTVKGALLTLFVGILLSLWMVLLVATALMRPHGGRLGTPELARSYGPMALLAYCVLLLALPSNERMIAFTPAEVNLLFPRRSAGDSSWRTRSSSWRSNRLPARSSWPFFLCSTRTIFWPPTSG